MIGESQTPSPVTKATAKVHKPQVTHQKTAAAADSEQGDDIALTVIDVISGELHVARARVVPGARLTEDLGADNLDKLEVEMGIEGAFDIQITAADWIKVRTVQDVTDYVRTHFKPSSRTN
jgi:acyl carrier protein